MYMDVGIILSEIVKQGLGYVLFIGACFVAKFFYDAKKMRIASLHESINKLENMTEPTIKEY